MASAASRRAALRRIKEPAVIPPEGVELPEIGARAGWRNPVIGEHYDRSIWEAYVVLPGASKDLCRIHLVDGEYLVRRVLQGPIAEPVRFASAQDAVDYATGIARALVTY